VTIARVLLVPILNNDLGHHIEYESIR
jgi:hypothetical protein